MCILFRSSMIQSIYKDKVFSDTRIDWVIYMFCVRCAFSEVVFFSCGGAFFVWFVRIFWRFYACVRVRMRVRGCVCVRACVYACEVSNPLTLPPFTSSPHRTKRKETKNPLIFFYKLKKSEKKLAY